MALEDDLVILYPIEVFLFLQAVQLSREIVFFPDLPYPLMVVCLN